MVEREFGKPFSQKEKAERHYRVTEDRGKPLTNDSIVSTNAEEQSCVIAELARDEIEHPAALVTHAKRSGQLPEDDREQPAFASQLWKCKVHRADNVQEGPADDARPGFLSAIVRTNARQLPEKAKELLTRATEL